MWKTPQSSARFEIGGKNMGKMEYLLGAALGIVIVGALILTIYQTLRNPNGPKEMPPTITYHCDSCGAEFDVPPPDPNDPKANTMQNDPMMGPVPVKCTSCGKMNAWLMNRCYKCKKLFAAKPEEHKRDFDGSKTTCPHCGTNQIDYLRETLK